MPPARNPPGRPRPTPGPPAHPALPLVAALGAALVAASWGLTRRPLWIDEAFSLGATHQLGATIRDTGGTMALYYVLLDGWTAVTGTSVLALRGLSVALVLVGIFVLYRLARRLLPPTEAALAPIVVAVLPATVRMAQDTRAYALIVVLTVSCWACLTRAVEADAREDRASARRWSLALVPLVVAGELSHGLFLLQVPALVLSVAVHLRHRPRLLLALAPAAGAGAATLTLLLVTLDAGAVGNWIRPLDRAQVEALVAHLLATREPLRVALALLAGVGAVALLRRPAPDPVQRWKARAPLWWALTAPALLVVVSLVRPSLLGRYVSGSVPALGVLIAVGLHTLWRTAVSSDGAEHRRRARSRPGPAARVAGGALVAALVALAISVPILDRAPRPGQRFEDWDAVADHIGSRAQPGDGIAFIPIGGPRHNTDLLRAPFEAAWTGRPGPRVELTAVSPARPLGQVRRFDTVLDPDTLSRHLVRHQQVWVVMVPGGWTTFLDVLDREPAASRVRRAPTATFNGGMQVVLLTRH